MILIIGGSGSGKSAFAEKSAAEAANGRMLYYVATMQIYGEEERLKVERHRKLRQGKGFLTRECVRDISCLVDEVFGGVVLLECLSNLVANEMFQGEYIASAAKVTEKIYHEICCLKRQAAELVIVSNNVFEDGICYDSGTMEYLKALGDLNCLLGESAETVTELVAGIPVRIKGDAICG